MTPDPITMLWIFLWSTIGSYGAYLLLTGDNMASSLFVYGKTLNLLRSRNFFWSLYLVPKRYFRHFYSTSLMAFTLSLMGVVQYYVPGQYHEPLIEYLDRFIEITDGRVEFLKEKTVFAITSLVFTMIVMIIQSFRRLYESYFVSVYANESKINIIHYFFGHVFYTAAALSTLSPILLSKTNVDFDIDYLIDNLVTKKRAALFVLFIYASHHQNKCHEILANLRKDKTGRVITEKHFVPSGGLFEYVTCPHFLIEIVIYFLIISIQDYNNHYWNLIFMLVVTTQVINAMMEHRWYKKQYKEYPKTRKAIIPYLL